MDVVGERILIFGDSLTHHGADGAAEIWDVDAGSGRASSAPGDLLASMLLEQGAQAVRTDANVGRSAHNFWAGNARRQLHSAQDLIASDQAWGPTKVIVMLGTNDADSGAIDANAMAAIRDAYASMGAEVWAIGPPIFIDDALNAKADQAFSMMSGVFGDRLIDARPLSSVVGRAGDGVHFQPVAAQQLALQLVSALATTNSSVWNRKPWLGAALGVAIFGTLGYLIFSNFRHGQLGEHEGEDGDEGEDEGDDDDEDEGDAGATSQPSHYQQQKALPEKIPAYFVDPETGDVVEVDQRTAKYRREGETEFRGLGMEARHEGGSVLPVREALAHDRATLRMLVESGYTHVRADSKSAWEPIATAIQHAHGEGRQRKPRKSLAGASSIVDVREQLKRLGIDEMISERDDEIHVGKIVVPKGARGAGTGTKAMGILTAYADRTGKRIVLTPSTDFGASSMARLKTFYKRFGFVENKGRHKDYTTRETMIRPVST